MNFIRRTFPGHLSRNVPVNKELEIIFFVDLNKHEISSNKIILFNLTEEKSVPIKFRYYNKKLTVKPIRSLNSNMHYQLQLIGGEDGIVDITGSYMEETYSFEFFTISEREIDAPVITHPAQMSEISSSISFEWMPVEDAAYYELEISRSNTFHNLEWPHEKTPVFQNQLTPYIEYKNGRYYVRVRAVSENGIKSDYSKVLKIYYNGPSKGSYEHVKGEGSGQYIIETSSRFATGSELLNTLQEQFSSNKSERHSKFKLIDSSPKHLSLNLKQVKDNKIVLTFNDKLKEESITKDSVYIVKERG